MGGARGAGANRGNNRKVWFKNLTPRLHSISLSAFWRLIKIWKEIVCIRSQIVKCLRLELEEPKAPKYMSPGISATEISGLMGWVYW